MTLPTKALSIRQPWAWAIIHAGKTLENRSWGGWNNHQKKFRGPFCVHASTGMTRCEYEDAAEFMAHQCKVIVPPAADLVRGAIIGTAVVTAWVNTSQNPWFMGPGALVLELPEALSDPIPCAGALGWFDWKPGSSIAPPAKWMLPKVVAAEDAGAAASPLAPRHHEPAQGELL